MHDRCLRVGDPIPITDSLFHWITKLLYKRADSEKEFVGKSKGKKLVDHIKTAFGIVKGEHKYSIHSITDQEVQSAVQILIGRIIKKWHVYEVSVLVISLAVQCANRVHYH